MANTPRTKRTFENQLQMPSNTTELNGEHKRNSQTASKPRRTPHTERNHGLEQPTAHTEATVLAFRLLLVSQRRAGSGGDASKPARGRAVAREFSGLWGGDAPLEQYAAVVTAVSSFWGGSMDYHPVQARSPARRPNSLEPPHYTTTDPPPRHGRLAPRQLSDLVRCCHRYTVTFFPLQCENVIDRVCSSEDLLLIATLALHNAKTSTAVACSATCCSHCGGYMFTYFHPHPHTLTSVTYS